MQAWKRFTVGLLAAAAVVGLTGCQDGRDEQIQALQQEKDALQRENADLQGRLASSQSEADNARRRALQLQQMLDDLRRQADSGGTRQEGDWTIAGPYAWMDVGEDILFDSGRDTLKSSGKAKLQQVAGDLKSKFPGRSVWVVGHTDSDPINRTKDKWKDNLDLSQGRARVVAIELMALGIEPASMIAGGQGEYNPKVPNTSKANKQTNRRVQIIAVTKPTQSPPPSEASNRLPGESG